MAGSPPIRDFANGFAPNRPLPRDNAFLDRSACRRRVLIMIRVVFDSLVKRYRRIASLDRASFELAPGELTVVLGPEGAGKTTLRG